MSSGSRTLRTAHRRPRRAHDRADDGRPGPDRSPGEVATCPDRRAHRLITIANAARRSAWCSHLRRPALHRGRPPPADEWRHHLVHERDRVRALVLGSRPCGAAAARPDRRSRRRSCSRDDNPEHAPEDWSPAFVDYLHLSFSTATAFSPTDVSAVKPWAKLMMMAEEAISLIVGLLVVARAVNILK